MIVIDKIYYDNPARVNSPHVLQEIRNFSRLAGALNGKNDAVENVHVNSR